MGKIVYTLSASLDGFIERPDGDISWHRVDEELHSYFNEKFDAFGAFVSGGVTYRMMADFWPTADSAPESTPAMVEFARIWRTPMFPPGAELDLRLVDTRAFGNGVVLLRYARVTASRS